MVVCVNTCITHEHLHKKFPANRGKSSIPSNDNVRRGSPDAFLRRIFFFRHVKCREYQMLQVKRRTATAVYIKTKWELLSFTRPVWGHIKSPQETPIGTHKGKDHIGMYHPSCNAREPEVISTKRVS